MAGATFAAKDPAAKFTDGKPSFGLEHAGDFCHRVLGVLNKAKDGHRHHNIESCVTEGRALGVTLYELNTGGYIFGAKTGGCNHCRVGIERRYCCALPRKFGCYRAIVAATERRDVFRVLRRCARL